MLGSVHHGPRVTHGLLPARLGGLHLKNYAAILIQSSFMEESLSLVETVLLHLISHAF